MVFIMMINRRLIGTVSDSKKYIAANVACQWVSLAANITMMGAIAHLMQKTYEGTADNNSILTTAVVAVMRLLFVLCVPFFPVVWDI